MTLSLSTDEIARARRVLMRRDPVLRAIISKYGACGIATGREADIFCGLVESIVSQQLSTKAAATIYGRLRALMPDSGVPTPEAILRQPDDALRAVGLSRQKVSYVRDLSQRMMAGTLKPEAFAALTDDEVITQLTQIKGIGRWTADMILIFRLARPDVLPVGDLGIVKAVQKAYGLRKTPDATRLLKIGEPWRPYRSIASWYLWRSLENKQ
jgi:DNA-3-methyladenine glycosylase II